MSIAEDYVQALTNAGQMTPDLEVYATAIGNMFQEVEELAMPPDDPDELEPFVARQNLCPSPSFARFALASGGETQVGAWTAVNATLGIGHSAGLGVVALNITGGTVTGTVAHNPVPIEPGQYVSAAAVVDVTLGSAILALEFLDANGDSLSGSPTAAAGSAGVDSLVVNNAIAPANAVSVSVLLTLPASAQIAVTDIQLFLDGPVPSPYWDGDTDGYYWTGSPAFSASAPTPPIPQTGWSVLFDIDNTPARALPYLAQWLGERFPVGLSEAQQRAWLHANPNATSGTVSSIADAVQQVLTGSQRVYIRERTDLSGAADPDSICIVTIASETPSEQLVRDALNRTVPAGVVINYVTTADSTWGTLTEGYSTWAEVEALGSTWAEVEATGFSLSGLSGYELWMP